MNRKAVKYLVVVAHLVGFHLLVAWWKSRRAQRWSVEGFLEGLEPLFASQPVPQPAPSEEAEEGPVGEFTATYTLGDDAYDPSFSIELPSGEFLGECGVSISEALSSKYPREVTALEVWLFDKNDIRTVTKVLMSDHAFHDDKLRVNLTPRGELVLAEAGGVVTLETKTLRIEARIVEVEYGTSDDLPEEAEAELPDRSFFKKVTVRISVWYEQG